VHHVLRALKTFGSCSRRQTYFFQSRMTQGIQTWVQNSQLSSLPSNYIFKKLFSAPRIIKRSNFSQYLAFQKQKVVHEFLYSFQYFCNFSTDPGSPAINFFRTGLLYAHILTKNSKMTKTSDFFGYLVIQKIKVACEQKLQFPIFCNFSDPGSPAIKIYRTGLTCTFILT
jgi:hypothetical protein